VRVFHSGSGDEVIAARAVENDDSAETDEAAYDNSSDAFSTSEGTASGDSSSASSYEYGNGNYADYNAGNTDNPPLYSNAKIKTYNKHLFVWVFTFLLGEWGIDRFLRGQIGLGLLKLFTGGGFGIWWFVDFIIGLLKAYGAPFKNAQDFVFIDGAYER
jgi:TM2 domain-containing membrane protein YozV